MTIMCFSEGKIAEAWNNWDQLGLLVQLGAVPPKEFIAVQKSASEKAS